MLLLISSARMNFPNSQVELKYSKKQAKSWRLWFSRVKKTFPTVKCVVGLALCIPVQKSSEKTHEFS
eukprot:m.74903 g.74903  ORF g.74903 m.74903 type:complete len:67 (+) comp35922_c0_seq5:2826-3026(+)